MFSLAVDEAHTVLLMTISGELSVDDFADADALLHPLVKTAPSLNTVIIDLRSMSGLKVTMDQLFERAQTAPALAGRRHALVVSDPLVANLSRLFADQRERTGHGAMIIVDSLEAAYRAFGINPVFR